MLRLYGKISAGIAIAFLLNAVALIIVFSRVELRMRHDNMDKLKGSGLLWVQHELNSSAPSERAVMLEQMREHISVPLRLEEKTPSVRADVCAVTASAPPSITFCLPLRGDQLLVVGPVEPPGPSPVKWVALFALCLTLTSAAFVAFPLSRKLRQLGRGIRKLSEGNLDARVEITSRDVFGEVATSFNQMAQRIQGLVLEREQLLQAVSHELGTPLSRIRFNLELLAENLTEPDEMTHQRLGEIEEDLVEIDALSTELVGWVEADAATLARERVLLVAILSPLVELAQNEEDATGMEIVLHCPEQLAIDVTPRLFGRAIENLLRNALRYAEKTVVVEVVAANNVVQVVVRDDGPGVPEEERERVFLPFTRLEPSRTRARGGMGLGLAIVKRIVKAGGGSVHIEEAPEGGAAVVTNWPREQSA